MGKIIPKLESHQILGQLKLIQMKHSNAKKGDQLVLKSDIIDFTVCEVIKKTDRFIRYKSLNNGSIFNLTDSSPCVAYGIAFVEGDRYHDGHFASGKTKAAWGLEWMFETYFQKMDKELNGCWVIWDTVEHTLTKSITPYEDSVTRARFMAGGDYQLSYRFC